MFSSALVPGVLEAMNPHSTIWFMKVLWVFARGTHGSANQCSTRCRAEPWSSLSNVYAHEVAACQARKIGRAAKRYLEPAI
jgi:hypothetical protein